MTHRIAVIQRLLGLVEEPFDAVEVLHGALPGEVRSGEVNLNSCSNVCSAGSTDISRGFDGTIETRTASAMPRRAVRSSTTFCTRVC